MQHLPVEILKTFAGGSDIFKAARIQMTSTVWSIKNKMPFSIKPGTDQSSLDMDFRENNFFFYAQSTNGLQSKKRLFTIFLSQWTSDIALCQRRQQWYTGTVPANVVSAVQEQQPNVEITKTL